MHILVLPSFYPSDARPHVGVFFRDQVQMLRRAGHQVGVLVAPRLREFLHYMRQNRRLPPLSEAEREGEHLYRMYGGWFPRVFPLITAYLHRSVGLRAFEQYCDEQGPPDLIHAHNVFYSGYIAAEIKRTHHIPVVLTEHSTNFLRGRIFLPGQHRVVCHTLTHCDRAFGVGHAIAEKLSDYQIRDVAVLDNVVDTDFFPLTPPPDPPFTFATAGRLIPHKNVEGVLNAFAAAFPGIGVRLHIGGGGPLANHLQQQARNLGIADRVTFLGWLERDQMRDLYRSCHVLVSASRFETFGLTLAEAMSCGRPVVATRSGGPEGFVTPETGLLVPVDDQAALTAALRQVYDEYDRYDPQTIRAYCENRFSEGVIVRRLEAIYAQISRTT